MPEQPKQPAKPREPRVFDAALETALANLRLTSACHTEDAGQVTAVPQQLPVQPPRPEILSRLVKRIQKI